MSYSIFCGDGCGDSVCVRESCRVGERTGLS